MVWYDCVWQRVRVVVWLLYVPRQVDGTGSSSRARPDSTTGPGTPNNVGPEQMLTTCGRLAPATPVLSARVDCGLPD